MKNVGYFSCCVYKVGLLVGSKECNVNHALTMLKRRSPCGYAEQQEWVSRTRPKLLDRISYGWLGGCSAATMVANWCEKNDVHSLTTFFHYPDMANHILHSESIDFGCIYPFRLFSRLLLRAIHAYQLQVANILVHHLAASQLHPLVMQKQTHVMQDLFPRLAKVLLTNLTDELYPLATEWISILSPLSISSSSSWIECRWFEFVELWKNKGGDTGGCKGGRVWRNVRASSRAMIVQRLFTQRKDDINETYVPYFSDKAYAADVLRILGEQCRIFVSKSQLCRYLFQNNRILTADHLTAVAVSWTSIKKQNLKQTCQFDSHDLQKLLLINDPDIRRERLDIITSASSIQIRAEELQRFHLTGFRDPDNPVPWIHATIFIHRAVPWDWMSDHVISHYLARQFTLRSDAVVQLEQTVDKIVWILPPELVRIISSFVLTCLQQLVEIDPITIPPTTYQLLQPWIKPFPHKS